MKNLLSIILIFFIHSSFAQWQLVWSDEFNGNSLDLSKWIYDTGDGCDEGLCGWGNNELQNYTKSTNNIRVENGRLIIEARREQTGNSPFSSGKLITHRESTNNTKFAKRYGRFEASVRMPKGRGTWPAFWMLNVNNSWPSTGEIDIMEYRGDQTSITHGTVHYGANFPANLYDGTTYNTQVDLSQDFHEYAIEWDENSIAWFFDGIEFKRITKNPYTLSPPSNNPNAMWPWDDDFYLILNLAIGGWFTGTTDPNQVSLDKSTLEFDYIRVYQENVGPTPTTGAVTLYKDCPYGGFSSGLYVGDYTANQLNDLGIGNNQMSSIRVAEGYKAILYDGDNFTGNSIEVTADRECVGEFNDLVSSVRVVPNGVQGLGGNAYYLKNRESGLFMDIAGGEAATQEGANLHQWAPTYTRNQQFRFDHLGDGAYRLAPVHSDLALDVGAISRENGANILQWLWTGTDNQRYIAVSTGDGYMKLIAQHSAKIIEVAGCSPNQQANVQQWDNNNQACGQWELIPVNEVIGTGNGLMANYFNDNNFNDLVLSRIDETIDANWGSGSPAAEIQEDDFSVRWTGQIQPKYNAVYTFYLDADDGRKLWIDGEEIINNWSNGSYESSGTKTLIAGQKYDIRIDYFEGGGNAKAHLRWSTPFSNKEIVPKTQLYANALPVVSITSPINNSSFNNPSIVSIEVNATDDNGSISKVAFYVDDVLVETSSSQPYRYDWNTLGFGTYVLYTKAYDNLEAVSVSDDVTIIVSSITNVLTTSSADFEIYPNPTSGDLFLSEAYNSAILTVIDQTGSVVFYQTIHNNKVDLSHLKSGLYTVKVEYDNEVHIQKLIKQ